MLIDWFTVIAQIANFLILIWLMKRYLYHPILTAIDAREKRIAAQLADAQSKANDAAKERDLFRQKNQTFDLARDKLIKTAVDDATAERQKMLETARHDADALRARRNEALINESKTLEHDLAEMIQKEVFSITRKTLSDLADVDLNAQMSKVFVQHLNALNLQSKDALLAAIKSGPQSIRVRSAFGLSEHDQEAIRQTLNRLSGVDQIIKFDVSQGLTSGIELSANGQKLAWSIADYLSSLDYRINTMLAPVTGDAGKSPISAVSNT